MLTELNGIVGTNVLIEDMNRKFIVALLNYSTQKTMFHDVCV
jgi:hypothetical protein